MSSLCVTTSEKGRSAAKDADVFVMRSRDSRRGGRLTLPWRGGFGEVPLSSYAIGMESPASLMRGALMRVRTGRRLEL